MGRRRRIAEGVVVREYDSGRLAYEIQFTYQHVSCRETLRFPVTKANDKAATARRGRAVRRLLLGHAGGPRVQSPQHR